MKLRIFIALVGLAIVVSLVSAHTAGATGDDYSCPAGTTFDYKVEPLSGKTFTVPTPPSGWIVTGVVLKVGGPEGGSHITFSPVTPGQVLSVAYQQYDISHAHVCKGRPQNTTTTTTTTLPEEETTTTTTTVPEQETTTTTVCVDCTPNTQVTIPATTTTVAQEEATTTTTIVALTDPPLPTTTVGIPVDIPEAPVVPPAAPTTVTRSLPVTGSDEAAAVLPWALLVLCVGGVVTLLARRKAA